MMVLYNMSVAGVRAVEFGPYAIPLRWRLLSALRTQPCAIRCSCVVLFMPDHVSIKRTPITQSMDIRNALYIPQIRAGRQASSLVRSSSSRMLNVCSKSFKISFCLKQENTKVDGKCVDTV